MEDLSGMNRSLGSPFFLLLESLGLNKFSMIIVFSVMIFKVLNLGFI